ncbi:MAG: hypothetical protein Q8O67_04400 [Deltaproteobacteria bacterium]|nr:hypothetical protein [Deltaproteobacteria bacterium]
MILLRLFVVVVAVAFFGVGCAHAVMIETEPKNARVIVDGEMLGEGAMTIEKAVFFGDTLRLSAEADGYEASTIVVPASEWYPWPGLLALVPLAGIPISLPALIVPILGPFIAAAIAVTWAVVTSPTLLSLGLVRKYPDKITIKLKRKLPSDPGVLLPSDIWIVPDDITPNPVPDVGQLKGPNAPVEPTTGPTKKTTQPTGGNPVP